MPETLVLCGGWPRPRRTGAEVLQLDVSPRGDARHRIEFDLDAVAEHFLDNVPDALCDLLEIATYVYAADRLTPRGSPMMARMGAEWRRTFRFRIPVRCPERWYDRQVVDALVDALGFLSEDVFSFEFGPSHQLGPPPYIGFSDPDALRIRPDEVILFSGGLDSTAGLAEELIANGNSVALATHKSANFVARRQDHLVERLRERAPGRGIFYPPVWVRIGEYESKEFTQRTRSFLFAALGILVARMFDRSRVLFFENGITSFNLPIADHVLGTRASRTTHPRVLSGFERLFSQLLELPIEIRNPYIWKTKAEVVATLGRLGCADLIAVTLSCANVRTLPMNNRQCGVCSQCIERRLAILAAGLSEHERVDNYAIDLLTGGHKKVEDLTMAVGHVLRALKLAGTSDAAFLANYGQIFRTLPYLPGSADENARRICELHRRYGRTMIEVVDRELRNHASLIEVLKLPATSLLAMINAPMGVQPHVDPAERERPASVQAASDERPVRDRRIIMAIDMKAREVIFAGGPRLRGKAFELFELLVEQLHRDIADGKPKASHAYIRASVLCDRLHIDEGILRKRVELARRSIERAFTASTGYTLDQQDVIQNRPWGGYRLNPNVVITEPAQLQEEEQGSRLFTNEFTTRPRSH